MGSKEWGWCEYCHEQKSLVIENLAGKYQCCPCFDRERDYDFHSAGYKCLRKAICYCGSDSSYKTYNPFNQTTYMAPSGLSSEEISATKYSSFIPITIKGSSPERIYTHIVEWLYLNDKAFPSTELWRKAFLIFLKNELHGKDENNIQSNIQACQDRTS